MKRALLLLLIVAATFVVAANDPGHDTLYIEENGDSLLTGNLNISDEQRVQNLIYSSNLHLVGNGTVLGAPSQPRIMGASGALYIDSTGALYLNTKGGTSSVVQMGSVSTEAIFVNVSGNQTLSHNLYLTNGQIVIGGTVRLDNSGVGTFASGTTVASQNVCLADGTNCPEGANGGIQNLQQVTNNGSVTTHNVTLDSDATGITQIMGNLTVGSNILYVNVNRGNVGIGTRTIPANRKLHVDTGNVSINSTYYMCFNSDCSSRIYDNGTALIIEGT